MFGKRWQLFHLLGIPIFVDVSWLIILALLTMSLARGLPLLLDASYPEANVEYTTGTYWLLGLIGALAFFGCIVLHELGHAVVGRSQKMSIGGITLFLFGGVAEIQDEPPSAAAEFLMAIAGPVVSAVLAVLLGLVAGVGYVQEWTPLAVVVLTYLALINGVVLVFNMVPAFPLDGGRVLRSILWGVTGNLRQATYWASWCGQIFSYVLIGLGILQFFGGNWQGGLWLGLIGLFLNAAARGGYQQVIVRQAFQGEPVHRFMNPEPIVVPPTLDLRQWVEEFVYRHHRKAFPVVSNGRLEGCIDTRALSRIPRDEWDRHTVEEVMRRDLENFTISPHTDALEALDKMHRSASSRILVTKGDQLVGILSLKDLLRFLNLKMELGDVGQEGQMAPVRSTVEEDTSPLLAGRR